QLRDQEHQTGGRTPTRQLFGGDGLIDRRCTRTPILLGVAERRQFHGLQRLERSPRILGTAIGLGSQWSYLVGHELLQHRSELTLRVGERDRLLLAHDTPTRSCHLPGYAAATCAGDMRRVASGTRSTNSR